MNNEVLGRRNEAVDIARGLAVCGMIFLHLVPLDRLPSSLELMLEGNAAVLFFVLAGIAWGIHSDRYGHLDGYWQYVARRTLGLFVLGLVMHIFLWSTEVLIPIAFIMAPTVLLRRTGKVATSMGIAIIIFAVIAGSQLFQRYANLDWMADGAHIADTTFGWATLRNLLFDGNYPFIPWLAFALIGSLLVSCNEATNRTLCRCLAVALTVVIGLCALTVWTTGNEQNLGPATSVLVTQWIPTTLPFILMKAGAAVAVIAGLSIWVRRGGRSLILATLGRSALTHYLAHIVVIFLPLQLLFPETDWSAAIGLAGFCAYLTVAIPLSRAWFRNHHRGPIEQVLTWISGSPGAAAQVPT